MYKPADTGLTLFPVAFGCMGLGGGWNQAPSGEEDLRIAENAVMTALEGGMNLFDHADIYKYGRSEEVFGEVLKLHPGLRERMVIQSKCGIRRKDDPEPGRPMRYDFSYEHILNSVEGSLRRLGCDYLDILLLHRPDPLMEAEEVARAFSHLHQTGKVRYFGVSNHHAAQLELLRAVVDQPLIINQVEFSLLHAGLVGDGIGFNQTGSIAGHTEGTLDYMRRRGILIQAWSPLARGRYRENPALLALLEKLAAEKQVTPDSIMLAWILRHPAGIQPVVGTTNTERISWCCKAAGITLSREEWYILYETAAGKPVP